MRGPDRNQSLTLPTEASASVAQEETVAILDGIAECFFSVDRDWRVLYFNHAAEKFFGRSRDEVVGRVLWEVYPQAVGSEFYRRYTRVMAERRPDEFETPSSVMPGRWIKSSAFPTPRGIGVAFLDATAPHQAEEELRDSEAHLAAIFSQAAAGFAEVDLNGRFLLVNERYCELVGWSEQELVGRTMQEITHPEDLDWNGNVFRRAIETGTPFDVEKRYIRADGTIVWARVSASPVSDGEGRARTLLAVCVDVTARKRSEAALQESEARFRHMADSAPALIWMSDETGQIVFANMHYDHLFGRPAAEMVGRGWRDIVLPEDLPAFETKFVEAFGDRRPIKAEVRVRDKEGRIRWLRCEGVPRRDDTHNFLGFTGCNVDITEAKVAEEHHRLLIHELNHRVKNTLATVQSIAAQTLRNAGSAAEAREAFEERLMALSRAHDVLTRENWEGASLGEVVSEAIAPYSADEEARFVLSGAECRLPPRMALALAMALQELATNAVKYGALSRPGGQVHLTWDVDAGTLRLGWRESGGPPVRPPTRRGFGSRLIERSLAQDLGGEVVLNFASAGVTCSVTAPLVDELR